MSTWYAATQMAGLIIPSVGTNFERHPRLQRFLLANDSTTIAVEVPVWLKEAEIADIESQYGCEIIPKEPRDTRYWPRPVPVRVKEKAAWTWQTACPWGGAHPR
jgi:hypothetical protein